MGYSRVVNRVCLGTLFLCLFYSFDVMSSPALSKLSEAHHRTKRQEPTSRDINVVVEWLKGNLPAMGMELCNEEDAYEGIRCPGTDEQDGVCASWDEICDGTQKCGLRKKDLCIDNLMFESSLSREVAEDQCSGEESKNACDIKSKEPPRCGADYELSEDLNSVEITSPGFPNRYPGDMYCFWRAKGPPDSKITVEFLAFNTEANYDYLSLGEGHKCDPVDRMNYAVYKHSGSSLPEPSVFTVNRNEIFASFYSDSYDYASGFHIRVSLANHDTMNIYTVSPPELNKTCGGVVNIDMNGKANIVSPNYPQKYDNLYECDWIIMAAKGRRLGIQFHDFVTEKSADILTIGIGRRPGKETKYTLSGTTIPEDLLVIEGSKGWLRFTTDDSNRRKGFKLTVYDYPLNDCGGSFEVPRDGSVAVASPLFPFRAYRINQQCLWLFNITKGRKLSVVIDDFSLSYDDILNVGSGTRPAYDWSNYIIKEATGPTLPRPKKFFVGKNSVWFYFRSNGERVARGFKAEIFDSSLYKPKKKPKRGKRLHPNSDCGSNIDREDVYDKITITSPGYPAAYGPLMECFWLIDIPFGGNIRLKFDYLGLETHLDTLTIGNGTNPNKKKSEVMTYTGFVTPPVYEGLFHQMWIKFNSDLINQNSGFSLTIEPRPYTACGGELHVPNGGSLALASPNYPDSYPPNVICRYVIHGPLHHRLTISIAGFETESHKDNLTITGGCPPSNSSAGDNMLLDAHSGRGRPPNYQILPRAGSVWVEFRTDKRTQLHGFLLNFADANLKAVPDEALGCPVYNRTTPAEFVAGTVPALNEGVV